MIPREVNIRGVFCKMKTKLNLLYVSICIIIAAISVFAYRMWRQREYIEYRGVYLPRKESTTHNPAATFEIPLADRSSISKGMGQSTDASLTKGLSEMIASFISAYASTNAENYIRFRFQETSEPWTVELSPERFRTQLPMWPEELNVSGITVPPMSRFGELIEKLRGYEGEDGTPAFCLPCVVSLQPQSVFVVSFKTNTIEKGFSELNNATSMVSKSQGRTTKQTFLSYPTKQIYPTVILSLMVNTTRTKGRDIILLQAVWLSGDEKWIPVGIGFSPASGYIAYPF